MAKNSVLGIYALILFVLFACSDEDDVLKPRASSIIGSWKLTEAYISAGGPQYWVAVEEGEEIQFMSNGIFVSSSYDTCEGGTYVLELDNLILNYACDSPTDPVEDIPEEITYTITFESDYVLLIPTSTVCIEGCTYKYEKITD